MLLLLVVLVLLPAGPSWQVLPPKKKSGVLSSNARLLFQASGAAQNQGRWTLPGWRTACRCRRQH